ncbi:Holliday junction resolvase RuvX [Corynebacterium sp.]|uniref:Holliday junction resolvase RuvX n=1 Tax=Corynebacterium TaxID=1716 RepID=UPI00280C20D2|nr:Holliday junction resolvase RuvX [Corynebacterium sp.]MDU3164368.1 Holliday junction resolvase RuvX [Corynebacterium sp.]MDU4406681.1 Holliday junction resolvase RuvX [Corynebacterium sp.]MDU4569752.1 Holliday junction resolvase RuvX [Corynebacterium sp.]MDU4633084.1 Holliday junction resolvase RuvX [Corynebacterium sp.]MDU5326992.1 Holliday junction resolvase RuvX [Corynebacterium sp.]
MAQVEPDIPGVDDPGQGRRLALDVGTVRIGVAVSNMEATLATPVETVHRETGFKDRDKGDIDRILELIDFYEAVEVIVGLPRDLQGNGSKSVKHAKEIAFRIRRRLNRNANMDKVPPPVRLADERLTTVAATTALRASGVSEKKGRKVIDQAAAVEILQTWLDGRANALRPRDAIDQPSNSGD